MRSLNRILLATDFSDGAGGALKQAIVLGRAFGAEVHLMHALHHSVPELERAGQKAVLQMLWGMQTEIEKAGVKAAKEPLVMFGRPSDCILNTADERTAGLILIGARQRKELGRFPLGTTAEKVIRRSLKPVWVVRPDGRERPEKILCAVDFSDPSRNALVHAIQLCRVMGASLILLNVLSAEAPYPRIPDLGLVPLPPGDTADDRGKRLAEFLSPLGPAGLHVELKVVLGTPHEAILHAAEESKCDLLVLGCVGRSGLSRILMGNTAEKVVREVPCSLLTVREADGAPIGLEGELVDAETHFRRGRDLAEKGFFEEALRQLGLCLAVDPYFSSAYDVQADVHQKLGHGPIARVLREQARISRENRGAKV